MAARPAQDLKARLHITTKQAVYTWYHTCQLPSWGGREQAPRLKTSHTKIGKPANVTCTETFFAACAALAQHGGR